MRESKCNRNYDDRFFTTPLKRLVLTALQDLQSGKVKPHDARYGLCNHLRVVVGGSEAWRDNRAYWQQQPDVCMTPYFKDWPEGTGHVAYPVPEQRGSKNVTQAQWAFDDYSNKWDKRTTYGRLRWELAGWLIEELTNELAEEEKDEHVSQE